MEKRIKLGQHHFKFEIRDRPWSGPLEKARQALSQENITQLFPEDFLAYMKRKYNSIYQAFTHVQFFQFPNHEKRKYPEVENYRIAVCYLKPIPSIRDGLYKNRINITMDTGWYPLVMGQKARFSIPLWKLEKHLLPVDEIINSLDIGELRGISPCAGEKGGTSYIVEGGLGNLLLDTGYGFQIDPSVQLKGAFLSHFHGDHSGGITEALRLQIPIYLSESTFRFLYDKSFPYPFNEELRKNSIIIERIIQQIPGDSAISFFPVFHSPGSYGVKIKDTCDKCLMYLGDLCLKNGFLDVNDRMRELILSDTSRNKWVLIDSTMADKPFLSISMEDSPLSVINGFVEELSKRNVVFCSESIETLIYAYILMFVKTRTTGEKNTIKLFASNELSSLAQSLVGPMIYRKHSHLDLFIQSVIGTHVTNFIESHRVNPLSSLTMISDDEKVIFFITPEDIRKHDYIKKRITRSSVVLAGTLAINSDRVPEDINTLNPRTVTRVSSPDWSFHSAPDDLIKMIKTMSENQIHTLLFHNWPQKLDKFIKKNELDNKWVSSIHSEGVSFG